MSRIRTVAIILGVILVVLPSAARAQATPTKIKLLTQNSGWALLHGRLYWTNDFGQDWRDITPPQVSSPTGIADVFFLDNSRGWVLRRITHSAEGSVIFGSWGFDLAYTDNAGASWTVSAVQLPDFPSWEEFNGAGALDFLDTGHGWMNLGLVGGSGVAPGALFSTDDGGETWRWMRKAPMIVGRVRFVTLANGWLAGGPSSAELFATHDGGETWRSLTLNRPHGAIKHPFSSYSLPMFRDVRHGLVVIADPWGREVSLFATDNGGRTWRLAADLPNLESRGGYGVAAADSELLYARKSRGGGIRLTSVGPARPARTVVGTTGGNRGIMSQISFSGTQVGWALVGARIFGTNDGGSAWVDITPQRGSVPRRVEPGQATVPHDPAVPVGPASATTSNATVNMAASAAGGGGGGGTAGSLHTSVHLGFDSSTIPPPSDMTAWWTNSPYYDFGVYIGGVNGKYTLSTEYGPGTNNPNVTPAQWVSATVAQGWGLIPFWVGLQSPCYTDTSKNFSTIPENDPTTAFNYGNDAASSAVQAASDVGLGTGSIIYYDMENYNQTDSTCQAAVVSFLDGWVHGLQNSKYVPGLYTNTGPAEADWTALSGAIQDLLVAKGDSRATIWGLDCDSSGCSPSVGLTDDTWGEGYRGHQYATTSENYGGTNSYGIDRDIEYAQVDGGSGGKTYSYCSTCFADYSNLGGDGGFAGINDGGMGQPGSSAWEAVGWTDSGGNEEVVDDLGGTVAEWSVDYGAYASGISNLRQLVGAAGTAPGDCYEGGTTEGLYSQPPGQNIQLFSYGPGPAPPDYGCGPTVFSGVNDDGMVAAYYYLTDASKGTFTATGFTWDSSTGQPGPPLAYSGWSDVMPLGINGFGQVVGQYADSRGNPHAFIEDNGVYTTISACKGATTTDVFAINNNEQVAGICGSTEFMYDLRHKTITTVYDPSAGSQSVAGCVSPPDVWNLLTGNSCAWGINDAAQIVGAVSPAAGEVWGFIATPNPQ